jgi:phosphoribosylglycinamide formyltransferase-1
VHFVTPDVDGGPIVAQAEIPIRSDDDSESLAARVLAEEHRLLPQVVGWFCDGRLRLANGRALVDGR